ncbi:7694_t:CDS:1, partial [Ambispora gerdemannii]
HTNTCPIMSQITKLCGTNRGWALLRFNSTLEITKRHAQHNTTDLSACDTMF